MGTSVILEGIKWFTTEYKHTTLMLIIVGAAAWPLAAVVLYMESRGIWVTPIMEEMSYRRAEHQGQTSVAEAVADAQGEIAIVQNTILRTITNHNDQSLKKDRMLAFFVYKACMDDAKNIKHNIIE